MDRSSYPHISMYQCGSVGTSKNPVQSIRIWKCNVVQVESLLKGCKTQLSRAQCKSLDQLPTVKQFPENAKEQMGGTWKGGFSYFKIHCSSVKRRLVSCYWWPRLSLWWNQSALQFFQITSWKSRTQVECFNYFRSV